MHEKNVGRQSFIQLATVSEALVDTATRADMPIAIIGMSCRFPGGADSPDKFWDLCSNGITAWSEIPKNRFNKDAFYHPMSEKNVTVGIPVSSSTFSLLTQLSRRMSKVDTFWSKTWAFSTRLSSI